MPLDDETRTWLLDSDPSLRWQVERDLLHLPESVWGATKARVATEGFGARLLALQDPDGQWAGGAYFPADFDWQHPDPADEGGQPYLGTTWSLNALREWGVDAAVLGDTAERLAASSRWEYEDRPYWGGEVDACINAFTLANGAWLGADVEGLAEWFLEHRMSDGGWNCEWVAGATVSSFHSTLNSIEGLLSWELATGGTDAVREARHAGEEYLLSRHLLRRASTGEVVGPWATHFGYPYRWVYSALRAADHLRAVAAHEGRRPDPRMRDAIELIRGKRDEHGRWRQEHVQPGRVWFPVDGAEGEPSRWLTFHAQRVLDWWDGAPTQEA